MLKSLIQIELKLLRLKLKTKSIIIQAAMRSMRQSVMYCNSYIQKPYFISYTHTVDLSLSCSSG
jgi:hypothetical protein